jgi:hypothetical protein
MRADHGSLFRHTAQENAAFLEKVSNFEDYIYILTESLQLEFNFDPHE